MTKQSRSFRANWFLNSIVLFAFICALSLVFFGGRLELALQQDTDDVQRAMTEVAPENWTAGIVNIKPEKERSVCPRNDVSTVPSSKRK